MLTKITFQLCFVSPFNMFQCKENGEENLVRAAVCTTFPYQYFTAHKHVHSPVFTPSSMPRSRAGADSLLVHSHSQSHLHRAHQPRSGHSGAGERVRNIRHLSVPIKGSGSQWRHTIFGTQKWHAVRRFAVSSSSGAKSCGGWVEGFPEVCFTHAAPRQ